MHNDYFRSCTFIYTIGHPTDSDKRDHRYNPIQTTSSTQRHSKGVYRIFQCVIVLFFTVTWFFGDIADKNLYWKTKVQQISATQNLFFVLFCFLIFYSYVTTTCTTNSNQVYVFFSWCLSVFRGIFKNNTDDFHNRH